jgi:hypothetical protein
MLQLDLSLPAEEWGKQLNQVVNNKVVNNKVVNNKVVNNKVVNNKG